MVPLVMLPAAVPLAIARTLGMAVLRVAMPLARAAGRIVARQALGGVIGAGRQELAGRAQADAQRALGNFGIRAVVTVDNRAAEVGRAIREAAAAAVHETAQQLVADARAEAPVRTGRLRGSIQIAEQTDTAVTVEVGAPYGRAVNDGHHVAGGGFVPGNGYWDRAIERARRNLEQNLAEALRRVG